MSNVNKFSKDSRLVSIVTPVYNSEKYLDTMISSVIDQTYTNWELILINDNSTDNSLAKILEHQRKDSRIRLHSSRVNAGAAVSRNKGIRLAKGSYIAFLDADDFWDKSKLSLQLEYMQKQNAVFTYTGYEFTNEIGAPNGNKVAVPVLVDYIGYLKSNIIWTSTVLIDITKVHKKDILMPDLSYGEDAVTWLNILSKYGYASGLNETLSYYRRAPRTLSSNKVKAVFDKWRLYTRFTDVSLIKRRYYYILSLVNASWKRV